MRNWKQSSRFRDWIFDLKYLLGRTSWDKGAASPKIVELVESKGSLPAQMLDLGCGTGTNCIYLARYGWKTVGVDFSAIAIRRARRKARWAGVNCHFHRADVTDLAFLKATFDLALDRGCLASIPPEKWERYAAEAARLVRSDGLYMLCALPPRPDRSTLYYGIAPAKVYDLFGATFAVECQEGGDDPINFSPIWYWLRRLPRSSLQKAGE